MSEPAPAWYYESCVAERLNLSRDQIKHMRAEILKKNKGDWRNDSKEILLSEAGLEKICDYVRSTSHGVAGEIDFSGCIVLPPGQKKPAIDLIVFRIFPNPRLLEARLPDGRPGGGPIVRVQVPRNDNFRPGMKIRATPTETPSLYKLEGRIPRYPGRF